MMKYIRPLLAESTLQSTFALFEQYELHTRMSVTVEERAVNEEKLKFFSLNFLISTHIVS